MTTRLMMMMMMMTMMMMKMMVMKKHFQCLQIHQITAECRRIVYSNPVIESAGHGVVS